MTLRTTSPFIFAFACLLACWFSPLPVAAQQAPPDVPAPVDAEAPADEPPAAAPGVPPTEAAAPGVPPTEAAAPGVPLTEAAAPDMPPAEAAAPAAPEEPTPPSAESATEPEAGPLRPKIGTKPYLVVPVDDSQKRERNSVMSMLRSRKFEAGEEERFEAYYRRYFLPRWTQPANINSLPLLRRELRNNLLSGRTGPPHARLNAIVLDYMGKMASANVHPAARVNAMLLIGELNEVEPVRAGDAPTALSSALPILLRTLNDDQQIDPVKVAALVGILRHAQFGQRTPEATLAIQRAMLQLAGSPGAPARSAEGHAWMRAQAAKALGLLRSAGENGAVPRLLASLVADEQLDMLVRCHAAAALGQINYAGAAGMNASQLVGTLGQLAADAIRAEADAYDADPESFSRRRLKAELVAVRRGLVGDDDDEQSRGIAPLATRSEEQQTLAALRDEVEGLLESFDDKQMDDAAFVEKLRASLAKIQPASVPAAVPAAR